MLIFLGIVLGHKKKVSIPHDISRARHLRWVRMTQVSREQVSHPLAELSCKGPYLPHRVPRNFSITVVLCFFPWGDTLLKKHPGQYLSPFFCGEPGGHREGNSKVQGFPGKMQKWSWSKSHGCRSNESSFSGTRFLGFCFLVLREATDEGRVHPLLTLTRNLREQCRRQEGVSGVPVGVSLTAFSILISLMQGKNAVPLDSHRCWLFPGRMRSYSAWHWHLLLPPECHEDKNTWTGSSLFPVLKRKSSALMPIHSFIIARSRARNRLLGCECWHLRGNQMNLTMLG